MSFSTVRHLNQSAYLRGCQCPKRLWLHLHAPETRDPYEGIHVPGPEPELRQLARGLFTGGVTISDGPVDNIVEAVTRTNRALAEGHTILYGAVFSFRGLLAVIDVLVQRRGKWFAYEVKAATRVKPRHITDATLHDYVLAQAGIPLANTYLLLLNTRYVRKGPINPQELFVAEPVGKQLRAQQHDVRSRAYHFVRIAAAGEAPAKAMGHQCRKPDPCEFIGFCSRQPGLSGAAAPADHPVSAGSPEVIIDQERLRKFLEPIHYPLCFVDFEAYQAPLPEFDGHWAFRQVPCQFSLHRQEAPGAALQHVSFLAETEGDPATVFLRALLEAAGADGTVLVYNIDFERMILEELKAEHPESVGAITALQSRMVDLMAPFKNRVVHIPAHGEKISLKTVLPALVPGMNYSHLAIANGADANKAFVRLRLETDSDRRNALRKALLDYCHLDTLALVYILDYLKTQCRD